MTFEVKVTDGLGLTPKVVVDIEEASEDRERHMHATERLQDTLERAVREVLQREGLQREWEADRRAARAYEPLPGPYE